LWLLLARGSFSFVDKIDKMQGASVSSHASKVGAAEGW
jgi:hypothetical protein